MIKIKAIPILGTGNGMHFFWKLPRQLAQSHLSVSPSGGCGRSSRAPHDAPVATQGAGAAPATVSRQLQSILRWDRAAFIFCPVCELRLSCLTLGFPEKHGVSETFLFKKIFIKEVWNPTEINMSEGALDR